MAKRLIPLLNRVLVEKIIPPAKTTAGISGLRELISRDKGRTTMQSLIGGAVRSARTRCVTSLKVSDLSSVRAGSGFGGSGYGGFRLVVPSPDCFGCSRTFASSLYSMASLNSGKIIAAGPRLRNKEGNLVPVSLKEGDTVLLPEYGGTQVKLEEKEPILLSFVAEVHGTRPVKGCELEGATLVVGNLSFLPNLFVFWHINEGIKQILTDYVHQEMTRNWIFLYSRLFLVIGTKDIFLSLQVPLVS